MNVRLTKSPSYIAKGSCQLVACSGYRVSEVCSAVMEFFSGPEAPRFLMYDWLEDEQLCQAALLWILDDSPHENAVRTATSTGIPLLVAESNGAICQVLRQAQCGLYYANAAEAQACLALLLRDNQLRALFGENARSYARDQSSRDLRAMTA